MKRFAYTLAAMIILMTAVGCRLLDPGHGVQDKLSANRARYIALSDTYTTTLQELVILRKAGKLSEGQIETVSDTRGLVGPLFEVWQAALAKDTPKPNLAILIKEQLGTLLALLAKEHP